MVISRTKYDISHSDIRRIFAHAGIGSVSSIRVLGAGEFNSVFAVEAEENTYVLKVGTRDKAVQIYEKNMMKSELHWYQVMREQTDIRIPRIFFSDFTKELVPTYYFIMEYIPGIQKDDPALTPAQRDAFDAEIARMVAKLHRIRGEKFGYLQSGLHDTWDQALTRIVENLMEDARRVNQPLPRGSQLLRLIDRYRDVLRKAPCRLISFDAWDGNFICVSNDLDRPEIVWIDPERCLWGDPLMDFVSLDAGRWKLAEKGDILAAYNELAEFPISGTREEEIRYAIGLCYLGVIMDCEKHYRYSPELPHWQTSIDLSDMFFGLGLSMLESQAF